MDNNKLVNNFIQKTKLEGQYTQTGDYKEINKIYKEIIATIKKIYSIDPEFDSLKYLFNHENDSVKKWAASVLLFSNEKEKASKVLKDMSKGKGLASFTAEMTLSEWKKGNLKPYYELSLDN